MRAAMLTHVPPKVLSRIAAGKQRYLFKRTTPRRDFQRVEVFTDMANPYVKMEILPGEKQSGTVEEIRSLYFRFSAMQRSEWDSLFFGCKTAAVIEILNYQTVTEKEQFNPVHYWRLNQPPQQYCYVPFPPWPLGCPQTRPQAPADELQLKE